MKWFALLSALGAVSASALAQDSIPLAAAPDVLQHEQHMTQLHDHLMAVLKDALKDLDAGTRDKVIRKVMEALKKSNALGVRDSILIAPAVPGKAGTIKSSKGETIIVHGDGTAVAPKAGVLKGDGTKLTADRALILTPTTNLQDGRIIRKSADRQTIAIAPKAQQVDRVIQTKPGRNTSITKTVNVNGDQASIVIDGVDADEVIVIVNGKKYRLVPVDAKATKTRKAASGQSIAVPAFEDIKIEGMNEELMRQIKSQVQEALRGLDLAEMKLMPPAMPVRMEGLDDLNIEMGEIKKQLQDLKIEGIPFQELGDPAKLHELLAPIKQGGKVVWYEPSEKSPLSRTSMQKFEQLAKEMEASARALEKAGALQKRFAGAKELEMAPSELAKMVEQLKRDAAKQKLEIETIIQLELAAGQDTRRDAANHRLDLEKLKQLELAAQGMKRNASGAKASELVEMAKRLEKLAKELLEEARRAGAK